MIYNINQAEQLSIKWPDVYFTPEYGKLVEHSDNGIWECFIFKNVIYVYLKKEIIIANKKYYDIISPYGYSGFTYLNNNQNTLKEFRIIFEDYAIKNNYITELIKISPFINTQIYKSIKLPIHTKKKTYGLELTNYSDYLKSCHKSHIRMVQKAIREKYKFIYVKFNKQFNDIFKDLYKKNMDMINANKYYYFNDSYFNELVNCKYSYLSIIYNENTIVAMAIFFQYYPYLHYHLSCNDRSSNCLTNFLIDRTIKWCIDNDKKIKLLHLGGGLQDNDKLAQFKKKIGSREFDYYIFKNIINNKIYDKLIHSLNLVTIPTDFFPIYRKNKD